MTLEYRILNIINKLSGLKGSVDEQFVDKIEALLAENMTDQQQDWWNDLPDSVKQDYDEGLKAMEAGQEDDIEDFLKKYQR